MGCKSVEKNTAKFGWEAEVGTNFEAQRNPFELNAFTKSTLDNETYNLIELLEFENKNLRPIKNVYKSGAKTNRESRQLWDSIERNKEEAVRLLTEKIRKRL